MGKDRINSVRRSMARGADARGTTSINENGKDAYKQSLKNTKGHYRLEFIKTFENMTEKDIELRKKYALDLISAHIAVPVDMITLKPKRKVPVQTLTSMDEVFYVKVGNVVYGKCSIRTQRLRKNNLLMFAFQAKKTAVKPPQKAFSRKIGFKKRSTSQKSQASRKSYRTRRGGKR